MATIPSPNTYVAGNKLTAAQLNADVRDAANFFKAQPAAVLRNSASQSIPNTTWTALNWDTEDLDNDNGHSTSTNTSRYTAVTAGWYLVSANVEYTSNGTGIRQLRITDGTTVFGGSGVPSSTGTTLSCTAMVFLSAGAFVQAEFWQGSGGALNTAVQGTTGTNSGDSKLSVLWVHS